MVLPRIQVRSIALSSPVESLQDRANSCCNSALAVDLIFMILSRIDLLRGFTTDSGSNHSLAVPPWGTSQSEADSCCNSALAAGLIFIVLSRIDLLRGFTTESGSNLRLAVSHRET